MSSRNARSLRHAAAVALALLAAGGRRAHAQRPTTPPARSAASAEAKPAPPPPAISRDSARALVLARRHDATVVSQRLMRRDGRQVYSFRVRSKGRPATERVLVDATTGELTK